MKGISWEAPDIPPPSKILNIRKKRFEEAEDMLLTWLDDLERNEIKLWKEKIDLSLRNKNFYTNLSHKGRNNIENHYDMNSFNKKLSNILFN